VTIDLSQVRRLVDTLDTTGDGRARTSAERIACLLESAGDPFARTSYEPGHITASGLVLAPERDAVLLVFHERLGRWLQPGGHVEPTDLSAADAARREVLEETGIHLNDVDSLLVAIDVHEIPAAHGEPAHFHHDLMFMFQLDRPATPSQGARAVWCAIAELGRYDVDEPLKRGIARVLT
jgi:8-oxo-dGTP pyrophosphatase MutT (NUDIX family)